MFVVWECAGYRQSSLIWQANKSLFHPTWGYNWKHSCMFPGKCLDQFGSTSLTLTCVKVSQFFTTQLAAYNPKYLKNLSNKGMWMFTPWGLQLLWESIGERIFEK